MSSAATPTVSEVAQGANLRAEVLEPLLTALGATMTTPIRMLAVIPADAVCEWPPFIGKELAIRAILQRFRRGGGGGAFNLIVTV